MLELAIRPQEEMDYDTAWLYCLTLDYNGHKDWRLPTGTEYSITDALSFSWFEERKTGQRWVCQPVRTKDD